MRRFTSGTAVGLAAGVAMTAAVATNAAAADSVTFAGKRINVIIGSSPGGGTDGTTRLVGRFIEKYLPGKPQFIYRNMPAGHGVKAGNFFAHVAEKDGTFWLGGSSSYVDPNTLRKDVVHYDPTKFEYIGGVQRGGSVVILRKARLPNLTDKSKPKVVVGVIDGSRSWGQLILWGTEFLGWNTRFVVGYPGSAALMLAARRGEIDMFGTSALSMHETMQKTGEFIAPAQLGEMHHGKVVARAAFQDVPVMADLVAGKLSGVPAEAFDFWTRTNQIDKWYALPPGTPKPIVAAYRAAWGKVIKDPEFIKYGRNQFSADFSTQDAEDVADLISSTAYPKAEIFAYMHDLAVKYGLPGEPLSDAEMAKLAAERGGVKKVSVTLDAVGRGGRELHFKADGKDQKTKVSSSRTKVTIGGKEGKRSALKAGMHCDIAYLGNGGEARVVDCR